MFMFFRIVAVCRHLFRAKITRVLMIDNDLSDMSVMSEESLFDIRQFQMREI